MRQIIFIVFGLAAQLPFINSLLHLAVSNKFLN